MATFADANGVGWSTERDGEGFAARPVAEPSPYPTSEVWDETEAGAIKKALLMVDTLNRMSPGGKFPVKALNPNATKLPDKQSNHGFVMLLVLAAWLLYKKGR